MSRQRLHQRRRRKRGAFPVRWPNYGYDPSKVRIYVGGVEIRGFANYVFIKAEKFA